MIMRGSGTNAAIREKLAISRMRLLDLEQVDRDLESWAH
jgi:hypothetical protein